MRVAVFVVSAGLGIAMFPVDAAQVEFILDRDSLYEPMNDEAVVRTELYLRTLLEPFRDAFLRYDEGLRIAREGRSPSTALFLATTFPGLASIQQKFDEPIVARVYAALYEDILDRCLIPGSEGACNTLRERTEMSSMSKAMFLKLSLGSAPTLAEANMLLEVVAGPGRSLNEGELTALRLAPLRDVFAGVLARGCPEEVHPIRFALDYALWRFRDNSDLPPGLEAEDLLALSRGEPRIAPWLSNVYPSPESDAAGMAIARAVFEPLTSQCTGGTELACEALADRVFRCTWSRVLFLRYIVAPATNAALVLSALMLPSADPCQLARIGKLPLAAVYELVIAHSTTGVEPLLGLLVVGSDLAVPVPHWGHHDLDRESSVGRIYAAVIDSGSIRLVAWGDFDDLEAARTVYNNVLEPLVKRCVGTPECRELHVLVQNSDMAGALVLRFGLVGLKPGQASILLTELAGGIPVYCPPTATERLAAWSLRRVFERIQNARDYQAPLPFLRALMPSVGIWGAPRRG